MREKTSPLALLGRGARDGIPIGLGYFAVAFALGIQAKAAGLTPFQGFLASLLCSASAGEYAGLSVIAAQSGLWMMAAITLITNARYLLMSAAMSQRMDPQGKFIHRLGMSAYITDEIFAITIARPGYLCPWYMYGAALFAVPCWAAGTALGILVGGVMPPRAVSALSVALFGMFLAIIIPPARKEKVIAGLVTACFASSFALSRLPVAWEFRGRLPVVGDFLSRLPELPKLSEGTRIILLTVVIASLAAILFPHPQGDGEGGEGR